MNRMAAIFGLELILLAALGVQASEADLSPADVYAAYQKALATGDGKAALASLTEKERERQLFEMAVACGMQPGDDLIEKHSDKALQQAWVEKHGKPKKSDGPKFVAETFRDADAFFSDALKKYKDKIDAKEPLRNVEISGGRARGVTTQYTHSIGTDANGVETEHRDPYDAPVYFAKTKSGWKIDSATEEEARKDLRELEEAADQE